MKTLMSNCKNALISKLLERVGSGKDASLMQFTSSIEDNDYEYWHKIRMLRLYVSFGILLTMTLLTLNVVTLLTTSVVTVQLYSIVNVIVVGFSIAVFFFSKNGGLGFEISKWAVAVFGTGIFCFIGIRNYGLTEWKLQLVAFLVVIIVIMEAKEVFLVVGLNLVFQLGVTIIRDFLHLWNVPTSNVISSIDPTITNSLVPFLFVLFIVSSLIFPIYGSLSHLRKQNSALKLAHQQLTSAAIEREQMITSLEISEGEVTHTNKRLISTRQMERSANARQVHDGPLQEVEILVQILQSKAAEEGLTEYEEMYLFSLHNINTELRKLGKQWRPLAVRDGLLFGLQYLKKELETQQPDLNIKVCVELGEITEIELWQCRYPESVEVELYRVAEEAGRNIIKHAQAKNVWIELRESFLSNTQSQLTLKITDDGVGFTLEEKSRKVAQGHHGLLGIEEQLSYMQGKFSVQSTPGRGTTVQVTLNL